MWQVATGAVEKAGVRLGEGCVIGAGGPPEPALSTETQGRNVLGMWGGQRGWSDLIPGEGDRRRGTGGGVREGSCEGRGHCPAWSRRVMQPSISKELFSVFVEKRL